MHVTVIIPTFNCADFLVQAVKSVLAQTYQDFEIIVVDDASTDHTEAALQQFGDRVRYIRQERGGPSAARNLGILQAQGELIAFLDADDLWRPTKLFRQVEYLNHHAEAVLVYTDFTRGPEPGSNNESRLKAFKARDSADAFLALLDENFIATPTVLVRRMALARSGLFDTGLRGSEDFELWLRLARTGPFGFIDEILADVRHHGANTSRTVLFAREQIRAARIMLERWADDPVAVRLLRRRLAICSWNLAFAEQCRGRYSEARTAYWSCARNTGSGQVSLMNFFSGMEGPGPSAAAAVARAAFMSLPPRLIEAARLFRSSQPAH